MRTKTAAVGHPKRGGDWGFFSKVLGDLQSGFQHLLLTLAGVHVTF